MGCGDRKGRARIIWVQKWEQQLSWGCEMRVTSLFQMVKNSRTISFLRLHVLGYLAQLPYHSSTKTQPARMRQMNNEKWKMLQQKDFSQSTTTLWELVFSQHWNPENIGLMEKRASTFLQGEDTRKLFSCHKLWKKYTSKKDFCRWEWGVILRYPQGEWQVFKSLRQVATSIFWE